MLPASTVSRGRLAPALLGAALLALSACADSTAPPSPGEPAARFEAAPDAPSPLVTYTAGATSYQFWTFVGASFTPLPNQTDPVNALIIGNANPLGIRAALMLLDGNRAAYGFDPAVFPLFGCTWTGAVGEIERGYAEPAGWLAPVIQLQCGPFSPLRFHVRLYDAGHFVIAPTHFDLHIAGTNEHEVISWELAEQLLTVDLIRAGILASPPAQTGPINPAPTWRTIRSAVYAGMPLGLKALIGGGPGIATNGSATVFDVADAIGGEPGHARQRFTIDFNQVIPKPFCSTGPFDYVYVSGPIEIDHRVLVTPSGNYQSTFHATGHLEVTPVNPLTSPPTPIGETFKARVNEHRKVVYTDQHTLASEVSIRILLPPNVLGRGRLMAHLLIGPGGAKQQALEADCGQ